MSKIKKVVREDGKVAIIISPGYGAGWSTWVNSDAEQALFDPEIVAWILAGKPVVHTPQDGDSTFVTNWAKEYGNQAREWAEKYGYLGGLGDAVIAWVSPGIPFRVNEYDGYESVVAHDDDDWVVA